MQDNDSTAELVRELRQLNDHYLLRSNRSRFQAMGSQFLRGLSFGLGSVMGATILVSILAYSLSKIDFIPIIGDYASEIAREITLDRNQ
ncbi:DUF5665 domain-containing protein [Shimia ponticola]|uniref:DUF5665 domain-containing protein n=1 Tax=Shimia ponticola TaxID=2582893 RepID=UPI0011BDF0AC|nr:DUF5665 domain-containing protein [Shimia ponticola]